MTERTLVLLKPDTVRRGLVGEVLSRFEAKGLTFVALEQRTIDAAMADGHYAEHVDRDFYPPLRDFVTSGPLVATVLEGDAAIEVVRALNGATDARKAAPGTIRGDLSLSNRENLVHGSDSAESAEREIALWFPSSEAGVTPGVPDGRTQAYVSATRRTSGGTAPRATGSGTGSEATRRRGTCPPQTPASMSSGSSPGPPSRCFIDASCSGTARTATAASSREVLGRRVWARPGIMWSTVRSSARAFSVGSPTTRAAPMTTAER